MRSKSVATPAPDKRRDNVVVESVPAQPNLLVSFENSLTPLEDNAIVPVHLLDGEIYTVPPLPLENDFGPSFRGRLKRLQVITVGLPGFPDEVLLDTDREAAARKKLLDENDNDDNNKDNDKDNVFEELMECKRLPLLRMNVVQGAEGALSLTRVNGARSDEDDNKGRVVALKIAAMHDMGNAPSMSSLNRGWVRVRFCYRGPLPDGNTDV